MRKKFALLSLVLVLGVVNWSIAAKEKHLKDGQIVFLELAPADPRSLMQGDYMALRFKISNELRAVLPRMTARRNSRVNGDVLDGYIIAKIDSNQIGSFKELYKKQTLSNDEVLMQYRVRKGKIKFATNAFFFQEGHAKHYETARYGQFRVNNDGELLLAAMYDKDLSRIEVPD